MFSLHPKGLMQIETTRLFRKQARRIRKGLQLYGIARRISEEHGRLFTRLTGKPDVRRNDECHLLSQAICQNCPSLHVEYGAKMANRDLFLIYTGPRDRSAFIGSKMRNDLVTEKVEINPLRAASALTALEHVDIKSPRGIKIVNWKRKMKGRHVKSPEDRFSS